MEFSLTVATSIREKCDTLDINSYLHIQQIIPTNKKFMIILWFIGLGDVPDVEHG